MLANPVVVEIGHPLDPATWIGVVLALALEIHVVRLLLRAEQRREPWLRTLVVLNMVTWPLLALAMSLMEVEARNARTVGALEGVVVLVEAGVIWGVARWNRRRGGVSVSALRSLLASLAGNVTSVVAGVVLLFVLCGISSRLHAWFASTNW